MDLPEQIIRVGAADSRETLLARLEATTSGLVVLRVTREAVVPRAIEDFQALKSLARRRNIRLRIVSPVASVVGLAKIYDIEAEFDATVGKTDALAQEQAQAAAAQAPVPSRPPPTQPLTPLPSSAPPATSGPPPTNQQPPSENDWLFGGLDVDTIESDFASERGRSAAPPPEFGAVPPPAPPAPKPATNTLPPLSLGQLSSPPPPAENSWLLGDLDLDSIEVDSAAARGRGAVPPPDPPRREPEPPPATIPLRTAPPNTLVPHQPGTLNAARDPLQDGQFLPDWLRGIPATPEAPPVAAAPSPVVPPPAAPIPLPVAARPPLPPAPAAPPLFAHGPAAKKGPRWVVPCPHCGEPMDLEMLIQKADYLD